jgi:hypothetical protein
MNAQIIVSLQQITDQLARQMGDQLEAVYLFGSFGRAYYQPGESDVNLLFVLDDEADIHALRQTFLPLWAEYGDLLGRGPWVARRSALARHMALNPDFARHLTQNGRVLHATPSHQLPAGPPRDIHETLARLTTHSLTASNALLPALLKPDLAAQRTLELRRLARQLWRKPLPAGETAVQTYARVQQILTPKVSELPAARMWNNTKIPAVTAPFLPGLQSLYKQGNNIVMVLAFLSAQHVRETDWAQMTDRLRDECQGVVLTTAVQLCLSLVYDNPLGLVLKQYQHNWGLNPLADLRTSHRQIMRQAARFPSNIELIDLPRAYLTQDDSHLHTIIHDFQNKLLNIRLEHELLRRFGHADEFVNLPALPSRENSSPARIAAIFDSLAWWADNYTEQMQQAEA